MHCWIGLLLVSFFQYSCISVILQHFSDTFAIKKVSITECTGVIASLSCGQAAIGVC